MTSMHYRRRRRCDVATGSLAEHSDSPRLDAEVLLGKVLGVLRAPR